MTRTAQWISHEDGRKSKGSSPGDDRVPRRMVEEFQEIANENEHLPGSCMSRLHNGFPSRLGHLSPTYNGPRLRRHHFPAYRQACSSHIPAFFQVAASLGKVSRWPSAFCLVTPDLRLLPPRSHLGRIHHTIGSLEPNRVPGFRPRSSKYGMDGGGEPTPRGESRPYEQQN